jgi:hypothetical protein
MKFPLNYKALNNIFLHALDPDIAELQGEYIVDILSFLPSFKRLSHRKVMHTTAKTQSGYNVLSGRKWGRFSVSEGTFMESDFLKVVRLNYDLENNFFLIKNIRDYIRCIEEYTLYIGKFYYVIFGYSFLIGYFSLEKIK